MTDTVLPIDREAALARLKRIQARMRDTTLAEMHRTSAAERSAVAYDGTGDTIYSIDRSMESVLVEECRGWVDAQPFMLIAEGLSENGVLCFPENASPAEARFRLIVDPLDGTRGLMYDKRSAWILAGLAPNRGDATSLGDIVLAVQTEVPTTKQHLADVLWASEGKGARGERQNVLTGTAEPLVLSPSRATGLAHGFASLTKFFPGRKPIIAEIEEAMVKEIDGLSDEGKVRVFDDQYISTGGQLYELMVGHDRFNGDIRPALMRNADLPGDPPRMAAHPYDISTELIARETGVIVTNLSGGRLCDPLTVDGDVAWLGYANPVLHKRLEPVIQRLLRSYGLL
jgi:fructose-1,6-bisphosphatase/inositol monophosphatase family enzyme